MTKVAGPVLTNFFVMKIFFCDEFLGYIFLQRSNSVAFGYGGLDKLDLIARGCASPIRQYPWEVGLPKLAHNSMMKCQDTRSSLPAKLQYMSKGLRGYSDSRIKLTQ